MHRMFSVVAALCIFAVASLPCVAQNVTPVIRLSPDEAAKTKQVAQPLMDAHERHTKARLAWNQFEQTYGVAHPDLPNLRFTEDCRFAIGSVNSPIIGLRQIKAIELTPDERQKLENLRRELTDSEQAEKQAARNWLDYQNQFLAAHVGTATDPGGTEMVLKLANGKGGYIPTPWNSGIAFTPDFRLVVPIQW